ncbi:MAG: penicillin-binding protein 1C [Pseudomonadota bacterium]
MSVEQKRVTAGAWPLKIQRKWYRRAVITACILLLLLVAGGATLAFLIVRESNRLGPLNLSQASDVSITILDRRGRLLRAFTTRQGRWRLPVRSTEVDQRYLKLLFAFEDKRFYKHGGIDYRAMARAAVQVAVHGRIVSGGSTLTMQVARLLDGRHERTGLGKLRQMIRATQLEARLSKTEILDLYLKLAPFGGNIEGARAAALAYFGKEPRRLSLGQAALLVALPQSPEGRRPDRFAPAARLARRRVLNRALETGLITDAEFARADREPVPVKRRDFPKLAPHLTEQLAALEPGRSMQRLTLDAHLQARLERLVAQHVHMRGSRLSAALMVVENKTGHILARVGSAGYFDRQRFGAIDMTRAVRSPGSALKPIVYGLGFERGLAHPETLIDDRPVRFGTYSPKNFDETYHGALSVREALQKSLNVPAVKMLDAVGPGLMMGRLQRAGIVTQLPEEAEPSLAIALGGLGIRLEDMARLYVALARGGEPVMLSTRLTKAADILRNRSLSRPGRTTELLSKAATFYITAILKDAPPPDNARRGQIAYKTGTSYGYRDAWAAGYDGRHTIVVWIGRPDAAATPGLTGRTAAAPILFDAFQRISPRRAQFAEPPQDALLVSGADLPEPLKRFERDRSTNGSGIYMRRPVRIAFPPDRSEVELGGIDALVVLKADGGTPPFLWYANDHPIPGGSRQQQLIWQQAKAGFIKFSIVDRHGETDRVTVRFRESE